MYGGDIEDVCHTIPTSYTEGVYDEEFLTWIWFISNSSCPHPLNTLLVRPSPGSKARFSQCHRMLCHVFEVYCGASYI